jgi:hypothetical protein
MQDLTTSPSRALHPGDIVNTDTAAQIGPRKPGAVYYDGPALVQVLDVVTNPTEARRILRRHSARFAVLIRDLHAGTERYTGAVWTGSDRVIKAVA